MITAVEFRFPFGDIVPCQCSDGVVVEVVKKAFGRFEFFPFVQCNSQWVREWQRIALGGEIDAGADYDGLVKAASAAGDNECVQRFMVLRALKGLVEPTDLKEADQMVREGTWLEHLPHLKWGGDSSAFGGLFADSLHSLRQKLESEDWLKSRPVVYQHGPGASEMMAMIWASRALEGAKQEEVCKEAVERVKGVGDPITLWLTTHWLPDNDSNEVYQELAVDLWEKASEGSAAAAIDLASVHLRNGEFGKALEALKRNPDLRFERVCEVLKQVASGAQQQ